MKKLTPLHNNLVLAALIFVLWSMGIFILPAVGASSGLLLQPVSWATMLLSWIYITLHIAIFAFVTLLLWDTLRAWGKRSARKSNMFQLVLYVYILAALALSLGLICNVALPFVRGM